MTLTTHHRRLSTGVTLEVIEQGRPSADAPSLVLLHGITDSWHSFEPVLPHLPPQWHVVVVSQRGHGGSVKTATSHTTADFAADVLALIDGMGLERPILVGHSMGAHNALRVAVDAPAKLRALVLMGAFARFSDKPDLSAWHAEAIAPLADPVPRALAEEFQLSTLAGAIDPAWLNLFVDESLRVPARIWREAFGGLFDDGWMDRVARLPGLVLPTWLAWGEADAFAPRADQDRLLTQLPNARLSAYPAGHALHWELPERFARDLVRFVDQL